MSEGTASPDDREHEQKNCHGQVAGGKVAGEDLCCAVHLRGSSHEHGGIDQSQNGTGSHQQCADDDDDSNPPGRTSLLIEHSLTSTTGRLSTGCRGYGAA